MFVYSKSCRRSREIFGVSAITRCRALVYWAPEYQNVLAFAAGCRSTHHWSEC